RSMRSSPASTARPFAAARRLGDGPLTERGCGPLHLRGELPAASWECPAMEASAPRGRRPSARPGCKGGSATGGACRGEVQVLDQGVEVAGVPGGADLGAEGGVVLDVEHRLSRADEREEQVALRVDHALLVHRELE